MKIVVLVIAVWLLTTIQLMAQVVLPTGLAPGSQYEVIFVTSQGTTATSNNIADYNNFVTQQAVLASGDIGDIVPPGTTWGAMISTQATPIWINFPNRIGSVVPNGMPVYDTRGNLLAIGDGFAPLTLSSPILDQSGNSLSTYVWTGTHVNYNGYRLYDSYADCVGGYDGWTWEGFSGTTTTNWFDAGLAQTSTAQYPIYGLSSPITVVPEPSSGALCCTAAVLIAARLFLREKRGSVPGGIRSSRPGTLTARPHGATYS